MEQGYIGGTKKGCTGRNLRVLCGFCFLGFLRRGPRQPFEILTNNLGSFKEMTNVHQGWKEKGEVVTFLEGRK